MVRVTHASRRVAMAAALLTAILALTACSLVPGAGDTAPPGDNKIATPSTVVNYRTTHPEYLVQEHRYGHISYPTTPPVGGPHNPYWQNCVGDVYPAQIANEHAVHSLEHGAVWVTYRPDLPAAQIKTLESLVRDRPFMFMSPYPGLDRPISLQAWGYQLKTDTADDPAIGSFVALYRQKATLEPAAGCSGGVTDTGVNTLLNEQ